MTQQSLQRLNAVISVGLSSPSQQPTEQQRSSELETIETLHGKLAKTLTGTASPTLKPWDKNRRVSSSCSLSTMAPDDASECGSISGGLRRMPKVWSSGSVCSMVSDFNDSEYEFELDIEAGAAEALKDGCARRLQTVPEPETPTPPEMSHSQVPRNCNMAEMYDSAKNQPPTTMMIRNVPGRYSQNDLMMDLQDLGFHGAYDFLYIPMDKSTAANVGYAFVNFIDAFWAARSVQAFEGYRFTRHQRSSTKVAKVSVAHLQGLEKNLQHYEKTAVNLSKDKRRRPVVLPNMSALFR